MSDAPAPAAKKPPATPVPATTILLLRPSVLSDPDSIPEVFMVVRHHQIDFASGALVFPGGKVDATDADASLRALCDGADDLDADGLKLEIGGVREAFEECGVLLARHAGSRDLIGADALKPIAAKWQEKIAKGEATLRAMLEAEGLRLALDKLTAFSHWITPVFVPKRFDTWFFIAEAPVGQLAAHDGGETVDSVWITAQQALDEAAAGKRTMLFPTKMNLQALARHKTVASAMADYGARPSVPVVMPKMQHRDGRRFLYIGPEAGYDVVEVEVTPEHKMAMGPPPADA